MNIHPDLARRLDGHDTRFALRRLEYGSYVSLRHRYMYVETPKAACTSIKRMLVDLEGIAWNPDALPYHRETRRDMLIHQRRYVGIPSLLDIAPSIREEILSGVEGWFVFAVVRNPFSRLVSVFENKIRLGEPRYRTLEARYGDRGMFSDPKTAFAAFIEEVLCGRDKRDRDPHFTSQTRLLLPRLIPYTHVFRLEKVDEMFRALRNHLSAQETAGPAGLPRENASLGSPWRDFYDERSARAVAEIYADDFREYDYDPEDWRGGRGKVTETEDYRRWRAELVERNAFIDRMFDWMEELRRA